MFRILLIVAFTGLTGMALAQENEPKGSFDGEWRTFYMHTFNRKELRDFYAIGTGGHAGYTYKFSKKWSAGLRIYTVVNTSIQDLTIPDETTGRYSRYESGLFNVADREDDFYILPGELFVSFSDKGHTLTAGRMKKSSPFINPQDGRMIPTLLEGIWYTFRPSETLRTEAAIITRISPRGTEKFYGIGESFGKYSVGKDIYGRPGGYKNNTESDFVAVAGAELSFSPSLKLDAWDYYVHNVFNATFLKPEIQWNNISFAVEWLHERRTGEGGNANDSLRYFQDHFANLFGAQVAVQTGKCTLTVGYDFITDDGRFLFPREWGREGIFTFQKRERSEGTRKSHALVLSADRSFHGEHSTIRSVLSIGHAWKPDPSDALRNKYAMPGYTHLNLDFTFSSEKVKGLYPELLFTWKAGKEDYPENPDYIINKVDMFQINMVMNYRF